MTDMPLRASLLVLCLALLGSCAGTRGDVAAPSPRPSVAEGTAPGAAGNRCGLWLDLYKGEPITYQDMLEDLASANVVYIGETHDLVRHHQMQAQIIEDLGKRGIKLVLGLEQMESFGQQALDRYARGEIDFNTLADETAWATRWPGYRLYESLLEAARRHGARILALNARKETIAGVFQSGGVERLDAERRKELPAAMQLDDPAYAKLLDLQLMVHMAANPERLRAMREAQIARDEHMAETLATYLRSDEGRARTAVVVCGGGHIEYGLGLVDRVRRRLPGGTDRILVLTESGDSELTPSMKAAARPITITHAQLRAIERPIADYLHATSLKP
jgi:uncharacterized iron-regulated protein